MVLEKTFYKIYEKGGLLGIFPMSLLFRTLHPSIKKLQRASGSFSFQTTYSFLLIIAAEPFFKNDFDSYRHPQNTNTFTLYLFTYFYYILPVDLRPPGKRADNLAYQSTFFYCKERCTNKPKAWFQSTFAMASCAVN